MCEKTLLENEIKLTYMTKTTVHTAHMY